MWVKKIQLRNFRNYSEIDLNFEKGINFFQGNNGSGKTSLVEAIGMLALCKSIRTNDDKEMIKVDNESCVIISQLENEIDREYRIVISKEGKFVWLDGNEIKKISEMVGICKIISFLTKDAELFKDSPLKRRKFLDLNLSMQDKIYLKLLSEYNHYLLEIKNLLKNEKIDFLTLDILLEELSKRGYVLQNKRSEFVDLLNKNLSFISEKFLDSKDLLKLSYVENIKSDGDYLKKIKEKVYAFLNNGVSRVAIPGIHLDDLTLLYNSLDLALYGSQGQNRLSVIALKLSLFKQIKDKFNQEPIIILDDVLSELDDNHQNKLINLLKNVEQVFITGTKFNLDQKISLFNVENNLVRRVN